MERFSERAFIKAGVIDALRNKIFIKDGKQYIFHHWIYDKKIYVFAFASVTGGKGRLLRLFPSPWQALRTSARIPRERHLLGGDIMIDNNKIAQTKKLQYIIDFLYTHNKNYTKKQWDCIIELKEIIDDNQERSAEK